MPMRWAGPLALLVVVGCAREVGYAGPGEGCVRSAQCQAGLACVGGQCTSDLSGLEGGVVPMPMMDAAAVIDAGPLVDTGVPTMDSGPPPTPDSGPPTPDSGPPDSGPPPTPDSGPPPTPDSGPLPTPDAGLPLPDAG